MIRPVPYQTVACPEALIVALQAQTADLPAPALFVPT